MNAHQHATIAADLLDGIAGTSERLETMTPDERLSMVVSGGFTRVNRDLEWTARLATAHALTSLALGNAGPPPGLHSVKS